MPRRLRSVGENSLDPLGGGGTSAGHENFRQRDRREEGAGGETAAVHDVERFLGGGGA